MVYVISKNGQPLMPCENVIARLLLKKEKAKVVRRCPFTIKLLYDSTNYTQDLTLGVDTGSSTLATAVSNIFGNILYMSEVKIRNDIADKMTERSRYRRGRRNRKTRYRKSRFSNRKNSKREDRFSPTMISKFNAHTREIEFIKSILPITNLILECGKFDVMLLKHEGEVFNRHWGYQKGVLYGFSNSREYVLERDNHTCQICNGKSKDSKLEIHHIQYRSENGSNDVENLICLCHSCHKKLHAGKIEVNFKGQKAGNLKFATQMNSIRIQLLKHYPEAIETFGYITKQNRFNLGLPKDHYIDACIIASGGSSFVYSSKVFYKKVVGKENRSRQIFRKIPINLPAGKICGFRKYDKVRFKNLEYFIYGRMSSGYAILVDIFGNKPNTSAKTPGYCKIGNLIRLESRKTVICI